MGLIGPLLTRNWFQHLSFPTKLIILMQKFQMMSGTMKLKRWKRLLKCCKKILFRKCSMGITLIDHQNYLQSSIEEGIIKFNGKNQQRLHWWSTQAYYQLQIRLKEAPINPTIAENQVWMNQFFPQNQHQNLHLHQQGNMLRDLRFN